MTFWYDRDAEELIGNNLAEFTEINDDGEVHIDVAGIMEDGRAEKKLKEMQTQITSALIHQLQKE